MSQVKELRALTDPELRQRLDQTHQDLRGLRLKASRGVVEQPHRIRQMRRDIARMLTLLGESRRSGTPQEPTAAS